ncbi:type IV pilus assembly protein PilZ [Solimonas aquatica]|uniref:Type IV pilus assembly protein PilZ n=1 Tax=Solimonas aquatica TaxID=489703 RepID=A0A1H9HSX5_9GAMM|nr:PilZ domain-containing protein [Solimonas aquatica]SEQ65405.1 type IV pilus assembly protein PilZ [Solimonas aquatica]
MARSGFLKLQLKTVRALQRVYLPFIRDGGLFVPSLREFKLGEQLLILLQLPDRSDSEPVAGRVVWLRPAVGSTQSAAARPGIGVQLSRLDGGALHRRIEQLLREAQLTPSYRI